MNIEHINLTGRQRMNFFERLTKLSVWSAYVGCISALLYAVFVRFYHAAGGTIGIPGEMKNPGGIHMGSYVAGVAILFSFRKL